MLTADTQVASFALMDTDLVTVSSLTNERANQLDVLLDQYALKDLYSTSRDFLNGLQPQIRSWAIENPQDEDSFIYLTTTDELNGINSVRALDKENTDIGPLNLQLKQILLVSRLLNREISITVDEFHGQHFTRISLGTEDSVSARGMGETGNRLLDLHTHPNTSFPETHLSIGIESGDYIGDYAHSATELANKYSNCIIGLITDDGVLLLTPSAEIAGPDHLDKFFWINYIFQRISEGTTHSPELKNYIKDKSELDFQELFDGAFPQKDLPGFVNRFRKIFHNAVETGLLPQGFATQPDFIIAAMLSRKAFFISLIDHNKSYKHQLAIRSKLLSPA